MKLDSKIEEALNGQVNQEMSAAYGYLAASAWFEAENFSGFAHWMELQRQEELGHAARLIKYLQDRGGKLELEAIKKPRTNFDSVMDVFKEALASEEANTDSIHALYQLAVDKRDYSTQSFLKWFIDEQVEEESIMQEMIGLLKHAGSDPSALLVLNDQVGKRTPEEEA
ncbi:MAG: ferritin [Oceanipulchritudo sp.]